MAKHRTIIGRTALLALIYDEDTLPSGVIRSAAEPTAPFCVHALREGDVDTFERIMTEDLKKAPKVDQETIEFHYWPFYDQYPSSSHECIGCALNNRKNNDVQRHLINDTNEVAKKLCEDCA